jgi:hypothetical protein
MEFLENLSGGLVLKEPPRRGRNSRLETERVQSAAGLAELPTIEFTAGLSESTDPVKLSADGTVKLSFEAPGHFAAILIQLLSYVDRQFTVRIEPA